MLHPDNGNVRKHAQAKTVRLSLYCSAVGLHLSFEDDDVRSDVPAARQRATHGESLGLLSMEERARLADGSFEIVSTVGRGTAIHIQFPVYLVSGDEPNRKDILVDVS